MTRKKGVLTPLSDQERDDLGVHELIISQGVSAFLEVGIALLDIRNRKLYREEHKTFEDYCQQKWGFTRQRGNQLIDAAKVATEMTTDGCQIPLENERQARALAAVVPHLRDAVLQRIKDADEDVTEQTVSRGVAALLEDQRRQQKDRAEQGGKDEEDSDEKDDEGEPEADDTPEEKTQRRAATQSTAEDRKKLEAQAKRWVAKGERLALALCCTVQDLLERYSTA